MIARHTTCINVAMVLWLCAGVAVAEEIYRDSNAIPILEHIGRSWKDAHNREKEYHITGTTSITQTSIPGSIVPKERIFSYEPCQFDLFAKGDKWRYEQPLFNSPQRRYYAIAGKDRICVYSQGGGVHFDSVDKRESRKPNLNGLFGEFSAVDRIKGYETVSEAMQTLVAMRTDKTYGEGVSVVVRVDEKGVFEVSVGSPPDATITYWFDSNKGWNMVRRRSVMTSKEFSADETATMDYKQDREGLWYLTEGHSVAIENGVRGEKTCRVTKQESGSGCVPDALFEIASLGIPEGTYTEDHRFTPALVLKSHWKPYDDAIKRLGDTPVTPGKMVVVRRDGNMVMKADERPSLAEEWDGKAGEIDEGRSDVVLWGLLAAIVAVVGGAICAWKIFVRHARGGTAT